MRSLRFAALLALAGCDASPPDDKTGSPEVSETVARAPVTATEQAAAAPAPATLAAKPGRLFHALGTEPFWSVKVSPGQLRYSSPETPEVSFVSSEAKDGKGVRYSGTMNGKSLSLMIVPGKCSDGMSDTVYEWQAELTIAGQTEQGCAKAE